jgi:E3 ubiquitin-protein ligase RNF216
MSRYRLICMSGTNCDGTFAPSARARFLDEKIAAALDRLEIEDSLRVAGLSGLASCPFCPYAEEYPSVAQNTEFTCRNPACLEVSCRRCNDRTHVPKSCEEHARDKGGNARHLIEEAMSMALIRRCGSCKFNISHQMVIVFEPD